MASRSAAAGLGSAEALVQPGPPQGVRECAAAGRRPAGTAAPLASASLASAAPLSALLLPSTTGRAAPAVRAVTALGLTPSATGRLIVQPQRQRDPLARDVHGDHLDLHDVA